MANKVQRGRFVWHELMTTDAQAAQDFYKQVVGWRTANWGDAAMPYTMWLADDNMESMLGGVFALDAKQRDMGTRPMWVAYTEVPDVDATIAQAKKLGGKELNTQTVPSVGRFSILMDPQGAVFAVITQENPGPEETDPQLRQFSWHELYADDWKAAEKFYNTLFGWEKKDEMDMGEMGTYYMFGRDRFTYGGMMNRTAEMPPATWLHYVMVDSADAAAERATRAGGQIVMGPMEVPGGDRITMLVDPQGAPFAVHSKKK